MDRDTKNLNRTVYKRLLHYIGKEKLKLTFSIVLVIFACFAAALAPYISGLALDELIKIFSGNTEQSVIDIFLYFLILMFVFYMLDIFLSYIARMFMISISTNSIFNLRNDINSKLDRLPLSYFDTISRGNLLSLLTNDVEVVARAFDIVIHSVIRSILTILLTFSMMLYVSIWLTVGTLVPILLLSFIAHFVMKKSSRQYDVQMDSTGKLNGFVEEYFYGSTIVALFNRQKEVINKFKNINSKLFSSSKKAQFGSGVISSMGSIMFDFSYIFLCFVGATLAIYYGLSIGMIQAFMQYLSNFMGPVSSVLSLIGILQQTASSGKRIFDFLDETEELNDSYALQLHKNVKGNVLFKDVQFRYNKKSSFKSTLNFNIKAGQKVAIVGPTGSGKTTIMNLLMRFYEANKGRIYIDNIDISTLRKNSLRNIFGMVLQDTWLFSGTILENIRYGSLEKTDSDVVAAAKAVYADNFIQNLPGTYDFILSEGGSNIAEGQKQLIAIARAFLRNPDIMILDEATANIDSLTELLIQRAIKKLLSNRTSFVIAHRLSTIYDSDIIFYVEDGKIKEAGSHVDLLKQGGLYAKLYQSQFMWVNLKGVQ